MRLKTFVLTAILSIVPFSAAFAEGEVLNSGDTAWMIVSTALVMMMTPADLALFYGGMSRYKNLLNTIAMTFVAYCPPAASESKRKMRLNDLTVQYMGKELLKLNRSVIA